MEVKFTSGFGLIVVDSPSKKCPKSATFKFTSNSFSNSVHVFMAFSGFFLLLYPAAVM